MATADPAINIQRVQNRVADGGHAVPENKIIERYWRSLENLPQALRYANRAFLFDTSEENAWYFAKVTDGKTIELQEPEIPVWFEPVWDSFD